MYSVYIQSRESWEWWMPNVDMRVGTSNEKRFAGRVWSGVVRKMQYVSGRLLYKVCILPSSRMVSFSFSTIDYKSLTYGGRFRAYNRFPYRQKQLFQSKR